MTNTAQCPLVPVNTRITLTCEDGHRLEDNTTTKQEAASTTSLLCNATGQFQACWHLKSENNQLFQTYNSTS